MKDSEPFELRLLAPAKLPRRGEMDAYVPEGDIGFVTDARLLELFDIDCKRSS